MQSGNPIELEMVWHFKTERFEMYERLYHLRLKEFNKKGEWFDISRSKASEILHEILLSEDEYKNINPLINTIDFAYKEKEKLEDEYFSLNL